MKTLRKPAKFTVNALGHYVPVRPKTRHYVAPPRLKSIPEGGTSHIGMM